jgi:hypothetical protein
MEESITRILADLIPLVRQFARGERGIALGGAHAKGVDDAESDIDVYLFTRRTLPNAERAALCERHSPDIANIVCWGEVGGDGAFEQAGSDFLYRGRKIECWLRAIDAIDGALDECRRGVVRHDLVTWTVMGFYNHCALSDLSHMLPVDDPSGLLARWQAEVSVYPPRLREAIIARHLGAAGFWPDNFHYRSAVERGDVIYTAGIVQQVAHNLIQVVFALNETYFPGDKKLEAALARLPRQPRDFGERIRRLLAPGAPPDRALLAWQREELCRLLDEVRALVPSA